MTIAIFGKNIDPDFLPYLKNLVEYLRMKEIRVVCEKGFSIFLNERYGYAGKFEEIFDNGSLAGMKPEILLSIGGDGTFLDSVVYARDSGIPVLGINSGRLGFLANVLAEEIEQAMDDLCAGCYEVEERECLELKVDGQIIPGFDYALNEVSVLKPETSSLLKIHAYIGEVYLTTYWADGLIIATPTGSTAYSLSGGGPIVSPQCRNIIITPVCPHNLSMRPLVVPDNAEIRLQVEGRSGNFVLSMDSRMKRMQDACELRICSGLTRIKVVKFLQHNYYETLRNKLMWGEDKRNNVERFGLKRNS